MNEKRIKKFHPLKQRRDLFVVAGDPQSPLGLISWGSVAGVALEALDLARAGGLQVKLLIPKLLYPVAEEVYADFLRGVQGGLVVEQSHQGQLYRVLRMYVNLPAGVQPLARSGSNPILPASIVQRLRKIAVLIQRVDQQADQLPVARAGRADRAIKPRYADLFIGSLECVQRPDQSPRGVGEDAPTGAAVHIDGSGLH